MRCALSVIWAIFTVLFLMLGYAHWSDAKAEIALFELAERPLQAQGSITALGADIDEPIKEFAADFNKYLKDQNESARASNRRTAFGYWIASLTAAFSMFIQIGSALCQRPRRAAQ